MLDKGYIIENSKENNRNLIGIYFLIKDNEIVYVGQTTKGLTRTFHHNEDKDFDRYYFMDCEEHRLDELETSYIWEFKPRYNKLLKSQLTQEIPESEIQYKMHLAMIDTNISLEAKLIYSYMLYFPSCKINQMINDLNIGKSRFYRHRQQLIDNNYITGINSKGKDYESQL